MTTDRPVNCVQLDAEAAALPASTHTHGLNFDSNAKRLWCVDMPDVCASALTAYKTHSAVFADPKATAIAALKASTDPNIQNVVKVLGL